MDELDMIREEIDRTDDSVAELLKKRRALALRAGKIKEERSLPIYDESREKKILEKYGDDEFLRSCFKEIIKNCRNCELSAKESESGK